MVDLTGVHAKLRRAKAHAADLQGKLDSALKPDLYRFVFDPNTEAGKHVLRVYDVPANNPDWTLIVGDCIMNIRGALDHLAWQLVKHHGGTPGEQTSFPIREKPRNKKGHFEPPTFQAGFTKRRVLDRLAELQPYIGPDGELTDGSHTHLWRLNRLNNIDKHRLLLVVVCTLDVGSMRWVTREGGVAPDLGVYRVVAKDGAKVATFDFQGTERPPDFDPHPALHVVLNETEFPELSNFNVVDALKSLIMFVEWGIVERFREFF
jgi:hypothetical protein